jgi:hypothetical protein
MPSVNEEQSIRDLLARQKIADLAIVYMRGLDRLIPDLVRSVFHEDATTDYGSYKGGPDGFVEFAMGFLKEQLANHHMIGQSHVEIDGDIAFGEVYFQAHHKIVDGAAQKDFFVAGRYVDRYENRNGDWKIAHRTEVVDWVRLEDDADIWNGRDAPITRGLRAPHDLSCWRDVLRKR